MNLIPRLTLKATDPAGLGYPEVLLDGQPIPWPTIGPVRLEVGDDQIPSLTVTIPVNLSPEASDGSD